MKGFETLSKKQVRAIEALISQPTIRAAAAAARTSETTLWRWLNDPVFDQAYRQARSEILENTLTVLQARSTQAVETLVEVMEDGSALPSARVSAARTILEFSLKVRETVEIEERLRAIEERVGNQRKLNLV